MSKGRINHLFNEAMYGKFVNTIPYVFLRDFSRNYTLTTLQTIIFFFYSYFFSYVDFAALRNFFNLKRKNLQVN